jgi:hypothetical protein
MTQTRPPRLTRQTANSRRAKCRARTPHVQPRQSPRYVMLKQSFARTIVNLCRKLAEASKLLLLFRRAGNCREAALIQAHRPQLQPHERALFAQVERKVPSAVGAARLWLRLWQIPAADFASAKNARCQPDPNYIKRPSDQTYCPRSGVHLPELRPVSDSHTPSSAAIFTMQNENGTDQGNPSARPRDKNPSNATAQNATCSKKATR